MKTLVLASATALILSISVASADNPRFANDNDHMEALSTTVEGNAGVWINSYGTHIVTSSSQGGGVVTSTSIARPASAGFLLHSNENDHKQVENQYAL